MNEELERSGLDLLVDRACREALSETDICDLVEGAVLLNSSDAVLLRLMRAGTVSARTNISKLRGGLGHERGTRRPKGEGRKPYCNNTEDLPFGLTNHAVEQYIARHGNGNANAMEKLKTEARSASPVRERTVKGDEQWVGSSGVIFVIRRDDDPPSVTCVTVLPAGASR